MYNRYLFEWLDDPEINDKLLLISGPRQVGKTTLAQNWLKEKNCQDLYFNWDDEKIRRLYRQDPHFFEEKARQHKKSRIVLDEIHKVNQWKTLLKGYYDVFRRDFSFLVTGSARLELMQRSGDSLLGRYHLLHLLPLNPIEVSKKKGKAVRKLVEPCDDIPIGSIKPDVINALLKYSGFPDPFHKASERSLNLWQLEYKTRLLREDLRDLTRLTDFQRVEHVFELLPARVGSSLSVQSLCRDVGGSHDSIKAILIAFEKLYMTFAVRTYHQKIQYGLKKEAKCYLLDWTLVSEEGPRFENMMAVQLSSFCHFVTDGGLASLSLHYIRDKQKREVDFLITKNGKPWMLIEVKTDCSEDPSHLKYYHEQLAFLHKQELKAYCVVLKPGRLRKLAESRWLISAERFLDTLWSLLE